MSSKNDEAILKVIFNPLLPDDSCQTLVTSDENEEIHINRKLLLEAKELERKGVLEAESGKLDSAIGYFDQAIQLLPQRPSGYNNRAQALRLKGDISGAMDDLNQAISVSRGKGRVASNALCQRALIRKLEGKNEDAMSDLRAAGDEGNEFAKKLLVQMNPYAALCNQMLHQMINGLTRVSQD